MMRGVTSVVRDIFTLCFNLIKVTSDGDEDVKLMMRDLKSKKIIIKSKSTKQNSKVVPIKI